MEHAKSRSRNIVTIIIAFSMLTAAVYLTSTQRATAAPTATPVVYIATGENFPDALGGGPAAALAKGPILLTARDSLPGPTKTELARLNPDKIVIIGGTAAVSAAVETALAAYAPTVERIAGTNRYDTAAKLSQSAFPAQIDADTIDGINGSSIVQHGEFVISHGTSQLTAGASGSPTITPYVTGNVVTTTGSLDAVQISLVGPMMIGGVDYGLKSVKYCIEDVAGSDTISRVTVYAMPSGGNIATDTTDRTANGCYSVTVNGTGAMAYDFLWQLGPGTSLRISGVQSTWAPASTLPFIPSTGDGSGDDKPFDGR